MTTANIAQRFKKATSKTLFAEIVTGLFILLFSYTALSKFLDMHRFIFQMGLAPVPLMKAAAPFLGWIMPIIESLLVIYLFKAKYRLKALYASMILMVLFEFYITAMLLSGLHLPCTCGGVISQMSWKQHVIFNGVFILLGITAILQLKKYTNPSPGQARGL